jgi:hypothetical protein
MITDISTMLAHPQEMSARVDFRIGRSVALQAAARTTPAGLAAAGILVSAILLSTAVLVRTAKGPSHA